MVARRARRGKQQGTAPAEPHPSGDAHLPSAGDVAGAPQSLPTAPPTPPLITEEYQRRVDEGRRRALEEDKVMFRPPFGYKIVEGKLVVDEEKRVLLKKILEDIGQGKKVTEVADRNGVTKDFVRRIRSNPIYRTGEVRYAGEVVFKVEPILPKGGR